MQKSINLRADTLLYNILPYICHREEYVQTINKHKMINKKINDQINSIMDNEQRKHYVKYNFKNGYTFDKLILEIEKQCEDLQFQVISHFYDELLWIKNTIRYNPTKYICQKGSLVADDLSELFNKYDYYIIHTIHESYLQHINQFSHDYTQTVENIISTKIEK